MVGLVEDRFPSRDRRDPLPLPDALAGPPPGRDGHLAEERRLFYVGMTRAREELIMTWAADYGGRRARRMSQFVLEALDLPPATPIDAVRPSAAEQLARHERPARQPATPGARPPALSDRPLSLSFYQVNDYLDCPAKFRFGHVIRIPTAPSHPLVYGRALHAAVQVFHRRQMANRPMSLAELHAAFDDAWESAGFLTREHEEARRVAGRDALARFWAEQQADPARPAAVEQDFTVALGRDRIRGRYDRVDIDPDGRVVITDYKSSDVRDPATANRRSRESLQLSLYALAWEAQHGKLPDELSLHFLESGLVGRSDASEKRLEKALDQVGVAAEGIRAGRFDATPSAMRCGYCPFREICPDAQR
jgi:DNA helicase-2/ATP-dependent DNA helicase PcrA